MQTACADAEALPFGDACFELVTCRIAAHHFPDVPLFVAEARRVLVPGGTLAIVDNIAPDQASTPGFSKPDLRDAALVYNAFEKIRDPSHGRCLGMAEWSEVLQDAGLEDLHAERLPKDMEFQPWAERMGADATTITRLQSMLTEASPALAAFLKPRLVDGSPWFTLDEAILVARKPA
jgi:ubiquinone/menaquinone biosynthesis C-methylase UbiE